MDKESALEELDGLSNELGSSLVHSEGSDDVIPFAWEGSGDFTVTSLLEQKKFLRPIAREDYRAKLAKYLTGDEDENAEVVAGWDKALGALDERCAEVQLLELLVYNSTSYDEWDDLLVFVALREKGGTWWAVGPQLGEPDTMCRYGDLLPLPSLPAIPDWLAPLTEQRMYMMHGQEDVVTGDSTSSGESPGEGPLAAASGPTRDAAIDLYLRHAQYVWAYPYRPLARPVGEGQRDNKAGLLDEFVSKHLADPRIYVLGTWANYPHFFVGKTEDGAHVGVMTHACWT